MKDQHYRAFGSLFFLLHQGKLLWLLNAPIIGQLFRYVLRISGESSSVGNRKVFRILPNAIFWREGIIQKAEFRSHAKFSKRIYYAFKWAWWLLHAWDWAIADRWAPRLSFGFSTLTKYPDANPETNTVDGYAEHSVGTDVAWSTLRNAAGNSFNDTGSLEAFTWFGRGTSTNAWGFFVRSIFLFDTSSLGGGAVISAGVLSLYGHPDSTWNDNGWNPDIDIYTSTPASNTGLVAADFTALGTVSQTGSPITAAGYNTAGYNNFTLNATGRGNISKTSITKFGARNANYDVANVEPAGPSTAWDTGSFAGYYADQTGTANDPKLVVTFTNPITPTVGSSSLAGVASRNDRGIITPTEVNIA